MSEVQDEKHDIGLQLEQHLRFEPADSKNANDFPAYIFAKEEKAVYKAGADNVKTYRIVIHIGPLQLILVITIDFTAKTFQVCAYGKVPIIPQFLIGCATGSFANGVTISYNHPPLFSGSLHFFIQNGWLMLDIDVTVLNTHYQKTVKVLPLPTPIPPPPGK